MRGVGHAVIAAAGFGSRLHQGIPKCLVEVNGHKIIEYQLALLREVPDVRVVVGYRGEEVIRAVRELRPDATCIRNDRFDATTTLQSYHMGCRDLHDFFILLDGDIIPHRSSLRQFLSQFSGESLVGIAPASTEDAVFVHTDGQDRITAFTRTEPSGWEWSNIAVLHADLLTDDPIYVYQCLERQLPLQAAALERLEIDTEADLRAALEAMGRSREYDLEMEDGRYGGKQHE